MINKKTYYAIFIFFINYIFLISYLITIYKGMKTNIIYFWISIIIMSLIVYLQIIYLKEDEINEYLILIEILLIGFGINLMYIATHTGLYGHDPSWDYSVTENIIKFGWPLPIAISERIRVLSEWPALHFLTIMIKEISGIDLIMSAKYLPSLLSSITLLFYYLTAKKSYDDKKTALLASFIFAVLCWNTAYHSKYIRETLAFMDYFAILFIIISHKNFSLRIILIIMTISLAFSHHLTCLMLILFLIIIDTSKYFLSKLKVSFIRKYDYISNSLFGASQTALLFIFTCILTYWLYIGNFTFSFVKIAKDDLLMGLYGTYNVQHYATAGSFRMMSGFYGNILFMIIFLVILGIRIIKDNTANNVNDIIYIICGLVMVAISYISTSLVPRIEFSRFIIFGFAILLISFANAAIKSKLVLKILFLIFCIFQIFLIPPYMYNNNYQPEYEYGSYREYYLPAEYDATTWFIDNVKYPKQVAGDWTIYELLGSKQVNVDYQSNNLTSIYEGELNNLIYFNWLALRSEDFFSARVNKPRATAPVILSKDTYNNIEKTAKVNKVYDCNEIIYYKIGTK